MSNKPVLNEYFKRSFLLLFGLILSTMLMAQAPADSLPVVIRTEITYKKSLAGHPENAMMDLCKLIPGLSLDLKYSTADNFLHRKLYPPITTTYLRRQAAEALARVQQQLKKDGLGLKIWDAYRPYTTTVRMWEAVPDDRYAANPKFGSGHNRGAAVDLTLINIATGKELDMGTGFDNFSDTAHIDFNGLALEVVNNRKLLQAAMAAEGFKVLTTEWWHFYLPDARTYSLMDLSFKQMKKMAARPVK